MKKRLALYFGIVFAALALAGLSLTACDDGSNSNQTPTAADYTIGNLSQTAGNVSAVTITPKPGKSGGAITIYYAGTGSTTYLRSKTIPKTAGAYAVTFDVAEASGWDAASGLSAGTLTIAVANQTPSTADYDISGTGTFTYDGSTKTVTVTVKPGKSTGAVTIYYNGTTAWPMRAGTYAVTFNVAAASGWNTATGLSAGTLTINAATPTADDYNIGNLTQTADSIIAVAISPKQAKSNGAITIYYNGSTTLPTEVGTYAVTFDAAAVTNWNAASGLSAGTLTISNATPTANDYNIDNLTQTVGNVTDVTIVPKHGKSSGTITVYYDNSITLPTAIGIYAVTFDVAEATNWNAASGLSAGTLTINPLPTPTAADYNIGNLTQTVENVTAVTIEPNSGKSEGAVTIYYDGSTVLPTAAGTYTVTFDVEEATHWNAAMGLSAGTLLINKAAGAAVSAPTLNTKTHNSITINEVTAPSNGQIVEYAINTVKSAPSVEWQTGTSFDGLNAGTTYYIFARSLGNNNYETGAASNSLSVTTQQTVSPDRIEYYWVNQQDSLVTTSGGVTTVVQGTTLTITARSTGYTVKQWHLNGMITGQSGNTYNFSSTVAGKHTVGLFVEKDGKLYNTNITITVK